MKVKVIPAIGGGEATEVDVEPKETVGGLKQKICEIRKIPSNVARLTFKGKAPDEGTSMSTLDVKEGDKFVLITRTVGGQDYVLSTRTSV